MATFVDLPFKQDGTVYRETDWQQWDFFFYEDVAQTTPVDFSLSTFAGEVLDKEGGEFLFDLTFNTPANDGRLFPKLTDTQAASIVGRTVHFWTTVTTGGIIQPYFYGDLTVSNAFKAGSV
jgi:hypothetical protein